MYPDDAVDIKTHSFFDRIVWDRHHLTRPPFVPVVESRDDTKYFDEEDPVSDVDDATSQGLEQDALACELTKTAGKHAARQLDGANGRFHTNTEAIIKEVSMLRPAGKRAKDKAKKRPRDKILRDRDVGRKALNLRKKGAFIGYTYRRPKLSLFDDDRGGQPHARRSLIPSFEKDL